MPGSSPGMTEKNDAPVLRRYRYRREVDEPALRLHKALDLRAHRTRGDVMGDIEEGRVVDRGCMQFGEGRVTRRGIEGLACLGHQFVELGIVDEAPVVRDR